MNSTDQQILTTLNQTMGAMFLADSQFRTHFHVSSEMLNPNCAADHQEIARHEIVRNLTNHVVKNFSKEIKKEQAYDGEMHSLELFIFPTQAFKLAVEFIISEMPQSEIDRIRTK
jgi:hypothetical protein